MNIFLNAKTITARGGMGSVENSLLYCRHQVWSNNISLFVSTAENDPSETWLQSTW